MCTLYNVTTNQMAIRSFVSITHDIIGNMEPSFDVYPDLAAPIVRNNEGRRELVNVRWGMPSSQKALLDNAKKRASTLQKKGKDVDFNELLKMEPDRGTTNIRHPDSKHWKRWLGVENRCVVPFTRYAEPDHKSKVEGQRVPNAWFASTSDDPLMFFAGIWVKDWTSVRKIKEGLVTSDLFGFFTCEPNDFVKPIHDAAMPVILKTREEVDAWLTAPWSDVHMLQRPLPDSSLKIVEVAEPSAATEPDLFA